VWCQPREPHQLPTVIKILKNAIKSHLLLEIAPDGGLESQRGTFGVVLAQGMDDLWEMAGPVDGDPQTSNSKRSKLAGYAASLEMLLMLVQFVEMSPNQKIYRETWIDSSGAGKHLKNMLVNKRTKRSYPHDPDLVAHIRWLWSALPQVSHSIRWVKSHQDSHHQFHDLPRNAQLNVMADALATDFAKRQLAGRLHSQPNPAFSH
jgi:hypothetical protein